MLTAVLLYLFPALMICAALWDAATLEIPNWLSLAVLLAFLALALAAPLAVAQVASHVGLGVAVLIVGTLLFVKGLVGGGDVKLLAATAVWVGWSGFPRYLAVTAVIGGIVAVLLLLFRRFPLPRSWASVSWLRRLHEPEQGVPYGVAIGLAGVLVFGGLELG